jgi:hypothetical protein
LFSKTFFFVKFIFPSLQFLRSDFLVFWFADPYYDGNTITIQLHVLLLLFEMQVSITPEVTSKKVSRDIIKQLLKLYKEHMGMLNPAYDGRKSLYTAGPLPFKSQEFVVKLDNDDRASSSGSTGYFSSLSV